MANIDKAFRVETLSLDDQVLIAQGTDDPTTGAGFEAPVGSLYLRTNGTLYRKVGVADTNWATVQNAPLVLHRHNGAVTQTVDTTPVTILLGTSVIQDANYSYNAGAITVTAAGWYQITYDISYTATSNNRTESQTYITVNSTAVPGSYAYGYHRTINEGYQTQSATVKVQLAANDVIRLVGVRFVGNTPITTVAESCRLNITTI